MSRRSQQRQRTVVNAGQGVGPIARHEGAGRPNGTMTRSLVMSEVDTNGATRQQLMDTIDELARAHTQDEDRTREAMDLNVLALQQTTGLMQRMIDFNARSAQDRQQFAELRQLGLDLMKDRSLEERLAYVRRYFLNDGAPAAQSAAAGPPAPSVTAAPAAMIGAVPAQAAAPQEAPIARAQAAPAAANSAGRARSEDSATVSEAATDAQERSDPETPAAERLPRAEKRTSARISARRDADPGNKRFRRFSPS